MQATHSSQRDQLPERLKVLEELAKQAPCLFKILCQMGGALRSQKHNTFSHTENHLEEMLGMVSQEPEIILNPDTFRKVGIDPVLTRDHLAMGPNVMYKQVRKK